MVSVYEVRARWDPLSRRGNKQAIFEFAAPRVRRFIITILSYSNNAFAANLQM